MSRTAWLVRDFRNNPRRIQEFKETFTQPFTDEVIYPVSPEKITIDGVNWYTSKVSGNWKIVSNRNRADMILGPNNTKLSGFFKEHQWPEQMIESPSNKSEAFFFCEYGSDTGYQEASVWRVRSGDKKATLVKKLPSAYDFSSGLLTVSSKGDVLLTGELFISLKQKGYKSKGFIFNVTRSTWTDYPRRFIPRWEGGQGVYGYLYEDRASSVVGNSDISHTFGYLVKPDDLNSFKPIDSKQIKELEGIKSVEFVCAYSEGGIDKLCLWGRNIKQQELFITTSIPLKEN